MPQYCCDLKNAVVLLCSVNPIASCTQPQAGVWQNVLRGRSYVAIRTIAAVLTTAQDGSRQRRNLIRTCSESVFESFFHEDKKSAFRTLTWLELSNKSSAILSAEYMHASTALPGQTGTGDSPPTTVACTRWICWTDCWINTFPPNSSVRYKN